LVAFDALVKVNVVFPPDTPLKTPVVPFAPAPPAPTVNAIEVPGITETFVKETNPPAPPPPPARLPPPPPPPTAKSEISLTLFGTVNELLPDVNLT
jgi:hypothetical protein